ncbi:MAG: SPASM domain-containing protein, partial [Blastocatellia bacterium]
LDGPQLIHDRYRVSAKGAATFSQVKKNLQTLRRLDEKYYNEKVSFSVVITPPYQLEEIVDFFERDDLARGHTTFVAYADRNFTKFYDSFDMSKERQALGEQIDRLQSRFGEGIRNGTEGPGSVLATFATGALRFVSRRKVTRMSSTIYPNGICVPGAHRTFVNPDGKLYLCERVGESLPIGDLDSGYDIEAIDEVLQRYIAVSNGACRDCWAVRFCGACFMDALQGPELRESAKNNYCDLRRRSALAALKEYSELIQSNPSALNDVFRQPDMISTVDLAMGCLESHKQRSAFENGKTVAADGASL